MHADRGTAFSTALERGEPARPAVASPLGKTPLWLSWAELLRCRAERGGQVAPNPVRPSLGSGLQLGDHRALVVDEIGEVDLEQTRTAAMVAELARWAIVVWISHSERFTYLSRSRLPQGLSRLKEFPRRVEVHRAIGVAPVTAQHNPSDTGGADTAALQQRTRRRR